MDDPLFTLRAYRELAPWSLKDLTALAAGILRATRVKPINAAANAWPSERTVRFYVQRGLVTPPDGRGTAATYGYRHLLEVLGVKLRQMEGHTLEAITEDLRTTTGDVLERRVAAALGPNIPPPDRVPLSGEGTGASGRTAKLLPSAADPALMWRRVHLGDGLELHVRGDHPLSQRPDLEPIEKQLADAVRTVISRPASEETLS